MDQNTIENALTDLSLGAVRFFNRVGSTNDEAGRWAEQNAPDLALVVADEQTAGRGRGSRQWFTPPGAGLAFSLILYPTIADSYSISRMTALGALAVSDALRNHYRLPAQIKWPNDVLVERRKVAGVLIEARWDGGKLASMVLGIGVNVAPAAVLPDSAGRFPATCVETALGGSVDRLEMLHAVLSELLRWRPRMASPEFLRAWESNLAFRGETVQVFAGDSRGKDGLPVTLEKLPPPLQEGQIVGLATDGALKLLTKSGETVSLQFGEIRLRPVDRP